MKTFLTSCGLIVGFCIFLNAAEFDIRDEAEFAKVVAADAKVQKLAGDMGFLEGPVWYPADGGYLIFSDIPNNELKKWAQASGIGTFRKPSNNANGNTLDLEGRLTTVEHSGRRVSVTDKDGTVRTVVDAFEGKKLNSPNDVVVKSDGTYWFTDPDYGLGKNPKEQPGNYVYRFDAKTKSITAVVKDFDKPNGLCFSPDEKKLYVADSGKPRHIRAFEVQSGGTLDSGKVFCAIDKGGPDGIRCDNAGHIWSSAGDGVHVFAPGGKLIGKILVPESPANLCFGGKTLYITARKSLYAIPTLVTAAKRP
jgi:gluconolactonase